MTRSIAVVNHKGGVGKTTSAVNIAAALAERGARVLLVDLDPQGSATLSLGQRDSGERLLKAMRAGSPLPVVPTAVEGLELVPAGTQLAEVRQHFTFAMAAELLHRCLKRNDCRKDWVIIDCPPSMGVLTMSALKAAPRVVMPVEANFLAMSGLQQMVEALKKVTLRIPELRVEAIIPCRAQPRRRIHKQVLDELEALCPGRVGPTVRENVALAEAPSTGQPITVYAPRSHGAEDYRRVAAWLAAREEEHDRPVQHQAAALSV